MPEIDNEQLTALIEVCKQTYPDIDPYIIWVYSMDYLLNEQGIYGDEKIAEQIREQRNIESGFQEAEHKKEDNKNRTH